MKGLQVKQLREKDLEELNVSLEQLETEYFKNKIKASSNQLENTAQIRFARRDIARIKTIIGEKNSAKPATAAKAAR